MRLLPALYGISKKNPCRGIQAAVCRTNGAHSFEINLILLLWLFEFKAFHFSAGTSSLEALLLETQIVTSIETLIETFTGNFLAVNAKRVIHSESLLHSAYDGLPVIGHELDMFEFNVLDSRASKANMKCSHRS